MKNSVISGGFAGIASMVAIGAMLIISSPVAEASDTAVRTPTGVVPELDVYYPGTEGLAPDEMRIVALGTGMPSARPKQAAACLMTTAKFPLSR